MGENSYGELPLSEITYVWELNRSVEKLSYSFEIGSACLSIPSIGLGCYDQKSVELSTKYRHDLSTAPNSFKLSELRDRIGPQLIQTYRDQFSIDEAASHMISNCFESVLEMRLPPASI